MYIILLTSRERLYVYKLYFQILLKMLEENKEGILQQLNEFFPRSGRYYTYVVSHSS